MSESLTPEDVADMVADELASRERVTRDISVIAAGVAAAQTPPLTVGGIAKTAFEIYCEIQGLVTSETWADDLKPTLEELDIETTVSEP